MTVSVPRIEKLLAEATERPFADDIGTPSSARMRAAGAALEALPALIAAVKAAERLQSLHSDFLGLPVLAEESLDDAVAAWQALREALAPFSFEEQP